MKLIMFYLTLLSLYPCTGNTFELFEDVNAQTNQSKTEKMEKRRKRRQGMIKKLNLSKEQIAQFKQIKKTHKQSAKGSRNQIKKLRQEFQHLMQSTEKGDGFRSQVLSKLNELQTLKNQNKRAKIEMALSIRELLTTEQIGQFIELRKQRRNGRGKKNRRRNRLRKND